MAFHREFLKIDKLVLPLKFVESMEFEEDEDLTVNILKNDRIINIISTSGNKYKVSVSDQLSDYEKQRQPDLSIWQEDIYRSWCHIITGK